MADKHDGLFLGIRRSDLPEQHWDDIEACGIVEFLELIDHRNGIVDVLIECPAYYEDGQPHHCTCKAALEQYERQHRRVREMKQDVRRIIRGK